jgi:hypothetical protein
MNKVGKTATKITERDGMTHVRYHNTDVVSFDSSKVILRTNGWKTVTTKARMNQTANEFNLPFHVSQVKGEWVVSVLDTVIPFTGNTLEIKIR